MNIFINVLIPIIMFVVCFTLYNWVMGNQKGNIIINFEERYFNQRDYIAAIQEKLESEGREVYYKGNGNFIIDGRKYLFIERNVSAGSMGGFPTQRTILKLEK